MNLGRGFPVPQDKGGLEISDIWVPATPEKPDLQGKNNAHCEMLNNQMLGENWQDLLGVYTGLLQNEPGTLQPQRLNPNNQGSPYNKMPPHSNLSGLVCPSTGVQSSAVVSPVEAYSRLPRNFNANGLKGVIGWERNIQQVEPNTLPSFRAVEQKIGNTSVQSLGEFAPQKVNSLAELMSMVGSTQTPNRSTYIRTKPVVVAPRPLAESSQMSYAPAAGFNHQQNHILHAENGVCEYNRQELPNGRLAVPHYTNYNLNLLPSSESGESSNAARPFSIGPMTPSNQNQPKNYGIIQVPITLMDETSGREVHNKGKSAFSQQNDILEKEQGESSINVLDKPTEAILTSPAEKDNFDCEIDLNKTPQLKTPKRRKHRPKVVIEGKPKKTPKPAATKSTPPDGKPADVKAAQGKSTDGKPKRKYVRKNTNKTSTPPSAEVIDVVEVSDTEPTQKSCKRSLNFYSVNRVERENHGRESVYQAQNNGDSKRALNLNLDSNNAEWAKLNRSSTSANSNSNNAVWPQLNRPSTSAMMVGCQNSFSEEMQQIQTVNSFVHSIVPQDSVSWEAMPPTPPTPKGHTLNAIARILNARNTGVNQVGVTNGHNNMHQHISGSIAQLVNQANSCEPSLNVRRQPLTPTVPRLQDLVHINGVQRQLKTATVMGSQLCSYEISNTGQSNNDSKVQQHTLEKGKMKVSGITIIEDISGKRDSIRNNNFLTQRTATLRNTGLTDLNSNGPSISRNSDYDSNKSVRCFTSYQDLMREFQQRHCVPQLQLCANQTVQKTSNNANVPITNSLCTSVNCNVDSAYQRDCKSIPTKEIIIRPDPAALKKRPVGRPRKDQPVGDYHQPKPKNLLEHSSKKVKGSQKELKNPFSIDEITNCMEQLHINDNGNALVPYKGVGAVVPYEEFDLVKKKHLRPRVDLDPETNRLWNLLMGKEGCESAETMDTDKQKWWEEERRVFRGRVDSFIARMHLVQGDRRFSKWKGSVVDSVIGVFLTQNVSDHLSSSAFMCLAAKFPSKKSTTIGQSYHENGGSSSSEHHMVRITFPDGTTCSQKLMKEPSHNRPSPSTQSTKYRAETTVNEKTLVTSDHARRTEEDIISSQSSSESLVFQASEDIRSSSGSNSEAEDGWNFGKNFGQLSVPEQPDRSAAYQQPQFQFVPDSLPCVRPLTGHQKFENPACRQNLGPAKSNNVYSHPLTSLPNQSSVLQSSNNYWTNMLMGAENLEEDVALSSLKENSSSQASANLVVNNRKGVEQLHNNIGLGAGTRSAATQNGRQQFQMPLANHAILNKSHELQTGFPNGSPSRKGEYISNHAQGMRGSCQQDRMFNKEPTRSTQASNEQMNDNSKGSGITVVTTEKEKIDSSGKQSNTENSATSNAKKRKADKEKEAPFDWDTLRRQAQSSTGAKERSWETLDSIDYEALKNADVRVISDTIKERGMNNMLAERMKDFLDRVVRDHGQVDLEWLRDVPPDKAKDYLLSIRGLGLKSVECVRLLTLHHLAFPVDTNVGRIAVRLGWVPLQPLPESLQLHLLELYPVLESIQKYLWPRLCKLDQETLYELHYQMITFGKVFCTKREPNCNACPMRAECRHFASAFASARLALPAPGEKQIVSSSARVNATERSHDIVKPMALPASENNIAKGIGLERNFEPFVEEPSTPEPPTELLEKDIEDAFYEDPDEIPVIKLNVEEFTSNLQSIIQEKMELGEGDMSKALVALSPELASIPVPKLKHVSRLRTEHQVYELPDSHPLLKGMDRREPDDPSPYLLAIWTPGETADSFQPPEVTCSSQGGGLCDKSTCFSCSSVRESQAQTVKGTILIPCRTAMRGSFPLNGTYFQVNEVFADHDSSLNPIDVPRSLLWNLPRRTVFFGTSVSTIFKGLTTEGIQYCFWKGFVCVRGFDQKSRAPRPLKARLHLPASKMTKQNE